MNILLFSPGYAFIFLVEVGLLQSIVYGSLAIIVQIALAIPFLNYSAVSYFTKAFEFSRQFLYVWTVNWKFVSEEQFGSSHFSILLLLAHTLTVFAFLAKISKQNHISFSLTSHNRKLESDGI